MLQVQCEELRINHLTLLLVVTMPYACWFLCRAYYIEDFKWHLHFSLWGCVLKGCYERGIFWRPKWRLKGIEDFNLEHRPHQTWNVGSSRISLRCLPSRSPSCYTEFFSKGCPLVDLHENSELLVQLNLLLNFTLLPTCFQPIREKHHRQHCHHPRFQNGQGY